MFILARAMLGVSGADVLHPEFTPHTYTAYSSCVYTAVEVVAPGCVHGSRVHAGGIGHKLNARS